MTDAAHNAAQTTGTSLRPPLRWDEVPVPVLGGFTRNDLHPDRKRELREAHALKKRQIMEKRISLQTAAKGDSDAQDILIEKCRRSCAFFINYFCFTYDDRIGVEVPFVLYDFQERKIVQPYETLVKTQAPNRATQGWLKSRAMGYTWVKAATKVWAFMFQDNWSILLGTENRDDLDDGGQEATHQTTFGKIRFIIDRLPAWMRAKLLGPLFKKEEFNKRFHLKNPLKPLNVIHGKQFGEMFGRSRRYSEADGDEVAFAEEMQNADTAMKQTTNRAGFGSTPKGKGTFFHQLMTSGEFAVTRFYLWWAEHPDLDVDWYNKQREVMTDEQIAQELDLSFEASAGNRVLNEVNSDFFITMPGKPFLFDPALEIEVILDPGIADHFAALWTQWDRVNQKGRVIDFVQTNRKSVDWMVPFILGRVPDKMHNSEEPWRHTYNDVEMEIIERHKLWGLPKYVYGDVAGKAQNVVTATSAWDEMLKYGIHVDNIRIADDEESIRKLQLMMRHVRIARELWTQRNGPETVSPSFGDVVMQWRYPKPRPNTTQRIRKPIHDVYCHGGDCLKMWAEIHDLPTEDALPIEAGELLQKRGPDIEYQEYQDPFRS